MTLRVVLSFTATVAVQRSCAWTQAACKRGVVSRSGLATIWRSSSGGTMQECSRSTCVPLPRMPRRVWTCTTAGSRRAPRSTYGAATDAGSEWHGLRTLSVATKNSCPYVLIMRRRVSDLFAASSSPLVAASPRSRRPAPPQRRMWWCRKLVRPFQAPHQHQVRLAHAWAAGRSSRMQRRCRLMHGERI